jgi:hypothetical protein
MRGRALYGWDGQCLRVNSRRGAIVRSTAKSLVETRMLMVAIGWRDMQPVIRVRVSGAGLNHGRPVLPAVLEPVRNRRPWNG